jgi:hypothetical protein
MKYALLGISTGKQLAAEQEARRKAERDFAKLELSAPFAELEQLRSQLATAVEALEWYSAQSLLPRRARTALAKIKEGK